jgi:light-regulated signal transduction histidine kinase (bacteriophytochrome)
MSRPIKEKSSGNMKLAVWQGDYQGKPTFSFSLKKNYKDNQTGEWKQTDYMSKKDLQDALIIIQKQLMEEVRVVDTQQRQSNQQPQNNQSYQKNNQQTNNPYPQDDDIPY